MHTQPVTLTPPPPSPTHTQGCTAIHTHKSTPPVWNPEKHWDEAELGKGAATTVLDSPPSPPPPPSTPQPTPIIHIHTLKPTPPVWNPEKQWWGWAGQRRRNDCSAWSSTPIPLQTHPSTPQHTHTHTRPHPHNLPHLYEILRSNDEAELGRGAVTVVLRGPPPPSPHKHTPPPPNTHTHAHILTIYPTCMKSWEALMRSSWAEALSPLFCTVLHHPPPPLTTPSHTHLPPPHPSPNTHTTTSTHTNPPHLYEILRSVDEDELGRGAVTTVLHNPPCLLPTPCLLSTPPPTHTQPHPHTQSTQPVWNPTPFSMPPLHPMPPPHPIPPPHPMPPLHPSPNTHTATSTHTNPPHLYEILRSVDEVELGRGAVPTVLHSPEGLHQVGDLVVKPLGRHDQLLLAGLVAVGLVGLVGWVDQLRSCPHRLLGCVLWAEQETS